MSTKTVLATIALAALGFGASLLAFPHVASAWDYGSLPSGCSQASTRYDAAGPDYSYKVSCNGVLSGWLHYGSNPYPYAPTDSGFQANLDAFVNANYTAPVTTTAQTTTASTTTASTTTAPTTTAVTTTDTTPTTTAPTTTTDPAPTTTAVTTTDATTTTAPTTTTTPAATTDTTTTTTTTAAPVTTTATTTTTDATTTTVAAPAVTTTVAVTTTTAAPTQTPPTASFTSAPSGLVVNFTDTSIAGSSAITKTTWLFGDGANDTGPTVSHAYTVAGTFNVVQLVTDANGLTDRSAQTITVSPFGGSKQFAETLSPSLGSASSAAFGQPLAVYCVHSWGSAKPERGYGLSIVGSHQVNIWAAGCKTLNTRKGQTAQALWVLGHEAAHALGITSEKTADCYASRRVGKLETALKIKDTGQRLKIRKQVIAKWKRC